MRIAAFALAAVFTLLAALQYNDPDPEVWMPYYGVCAVLSLAFGLRRLWILTAALALLSLGWGLALAPRVVGQQHLYHDEEGREMVALLLVALWGGVMTWRLGRPG